MANINLTPGERYTFAKLKGISVITDSTDNAETPKYIRNTLIITSSNASIIQINDYGTADPYLRFSTGFATADNWSIGVDNSDSGALKINNAGSLSTGGSMALRIDTDENISMPGDVSITGSFALVGIANTVTTNALYYNTTTKQVTYGLVSGSGGGGSTSPGGSDQQIQYNNAGAFGGVSTLTWDGSLLRATGSFTGSLTGIASSGSSILISNTPATAGTYYPLFVSNISGYGQARVDNSTYTYNTLTNTLTVTSSYAETASIAITALTASSATTALTASYVNPLRQTVIVTGSLIVSGSSTFTNIGPAIFSGSVATNTGFTGSLLGTASFASVALTANATALAISSSYAFNATSASYAVTASYFPNALTPSGGEGAVQFTNGSGIAGNSRFTYDNVNNIVNINNGGILNATGSLLGTASVAMSAATTRIATAGIYYPVFVDSANGVAAAETLWTSTGNISMNPASGSVTAVSFTGSLRGTATTASFVTNLNQTVILGNITSTPSTENTLNVYPPIISGTGEGGQILLAASGGLYTSASMLDTWQDNFRILKGTNTAGSTAQAFAVNLHNGNVTAGGTISPSAWTAGQTIQTKLYSASDLSFTTNYTNATNTYSSIVSGTYTPLSTSSYILFEVYAMYDVNGGGGDSFFSQITWNGAEIGVQRQVWANGAGGGTRSGTLFPLVGRVTNGSLTGYTWAVNTRRDSSDDTITVYPNAGFYVKITEIGR